VNLEKWVNQIDHEKTSLSKGPVFLNAPKAFRNTVLTGAL